MHSLAHVRVGADFEAATVWRACMHLPLACCALSARPRALLPSCAVSLSVAACPRQRRHLLSTISRCITDNMDAIVRVACRDSGKAKVDAYMGEVLTTLEKIRWICRCRSRPIQ